jgi:MFS family permease
MIHKLESFSFFSLLRIFGAPLISVVLMMLSGGFFITFISLYLDLNGASKLQIGIIQSAYYAGMLLGSFKMEGIIRKIGHVQSLCAFGALATATIIMQMLSSNFYFWTLLRFTSGISLAAIYIVIESWMLNHNSTKSKGVILSVYMISLYSSQAISQQFLKYLDINSHSPFIISALLASLAIIPISFSNHKIEVATIEDSSSFMKMIKTAPFGVLSCVMSGLILSALYSFFPIYIESRGLCTQNMMSIMIIGGVLLQWPIGKLSDLFDRRKVLLSIILASLFTCILGFTYTGLNPFILYAIAFLIGGFSFTLYPIALTYVCERIHESETTKATALLLIAYGIGSISGPIICSVFASCFGMSSIFCYLALVLFLVGLRGLLTFQKESLPEGS